MSHSSAQVSALCPHTATLLQAMLCRGVLQAMLCRGVLHAELQRLNDAVVVFTAVLKHKPRRCVRLCCPSKGACSLGVVCKSCCLEGQHACSKLAWKNGLHAREYGE